MKKVLSCVLVALMLASVLVMGASAKVRDDGLNHDYGSIEIVERKSKLIQHLLIHKGYAENYNGFGHALGDLNKEFLKGTAVCLADPFADVYTDDLYAILSRESEMT